MVFLLVDENPECLTELKNYLHKICPKAVLKEFTNAQKALDYGLNHHVDVVFTDVMMKGANGYSITKQLKQKDRTIFVAIVTNSQEYALEAYRVFANDYILKPVTPERLQESLQVRDRLFT